MPGVQLVFRWSSTEQDKIAVAGGCMTQGRSQTHTHTQSNMSYDREWGCRDAEYGFGLVTAGKPNTEKGRADEKPMNSENKKAARGKGIGKSKR